MNSLVGVGIYSVQEAAAITGIEPRKIRRWLFGANKIVDGQKVKTGELWQSELAFSDVLDNISFHDLLELRFVNSFRDHGVSFQAIRVAAEHAKELLGSPYPFTCKQFQTDGRSIFATTLEQTGDTCLIDIVKKQIVFKQVISPSLYAGIEYNDDQTAARWFPVKGSKKVVLDPSRAFGKPIITNYGVTTEVIFSAWLAEGKDARLVAEIYEIPTDLVQAAVNFEQRIALNEILH